MSVEASPHRHQRSLVRAKLRADPTWPTSVVACLGAVAYLSIHGPLTPDAHATAAALSAAYLGALSVMAPAIVRRIILRLGGAGGPIVSTTRGADDLATRALASRWRITAIFAGMVVSVIGAAAGAGLSVSLEPGTHTHATVEFVRALNVTLLASALVPAPGLTGWALLLGLVDAARVTPEERIHRAARVARGIGVPVLGAVSVAAALLVDPVLLVGGLLLVLLTWTRGGQAAERDAAFQRQVAAGREALVRFLCVQTAGEIAVPTAHRVGRRAVIAAVHAAVQDGDAVALVEEGGQIIGVIGPRQRAARGATRPDTPCEAIMVPIASLSVLEPRSPAVALLPELARHGFSLVAGATGLAYVTPASLGLLVGSLTGRDEAGPG